MKKLFNTFVFAGALAISLSACEKASLDTISKAGLSNCPTEAVYPVQFIGHAFGRGSIRFMPNPDDEHSLAYEVVVNASNSDTPDIAVRGIAQCINGIVSGKFGAGTTSKAALQVLGGSFEGVFHLESINSPFGRWQISLHDAEKEKRYELSGFWEEKSPAQITQSIDAS